MTQTRDGRLLVMQEAGAAAGREGRHSGPYSCHPPL